jgi:bifunctional oligoribonuclease and PAP phosphatase NrnA
LPRFANFGTAVFFYICRILFIGKDELMMLGDIAQIINSVDNVLIVTHERPDGDAIGSVSALQAYFEEVGKNASIFLPEEISDKYKKYLSKKDLFIELLPPEKLKFDFVICLDCSDEKRLGLPDSLRGQIPKNKMINIDHHFDNEKFALENYVDSKACACSEILFDILTMIPNYKMSKRIANCILLAIITDTGGLRFDNTLSVVFTKVSSLIDFGAEYLKIIKEIYFRKSYPVYLLEADIALNHLKWSFDNRFVYAYISDDLLLKYDLSLKDIEGVIDSYRVLDNALIAALITKRNNGFKISLRSSNDKYPVVEIAHALNGGGHKLAAGCFIETESFLFAEKKLNALVGHVLN